MSSTAVQEAFPGGRRLADMPEEAKQSSRRSRLWELPAETHCPVIGVCLPMPALRKLIGKALGSRPVAGDYEFHVAAVAECARRRPVAEAIQRELDRRYAQTLRHFSQARTGDALSALWAKALQGPGIAGALWATLSHPRCDDALRERVCRDIHMFQHQVGACNRADLQRLEQLQEENAQLHRQLAEAGARHTRLLDRHVVRSAELNAELMRVRGQVIARDSALAAANDELAALKAQVPELSARSDLARRVELQRHRIHELERYRRGWQERAARAEEHAESLEREVAVLRSSMQRRTAADDADAGSAAAQADLRDKAVLCVGGRPASVPAYRRIVESTGGRFLHHDGGEENGTAQLEASLAAADLVICQTGCVSHGAYWRVKDHCKRTGKQCVFVEKPSASRLVHSLRGLGRDTAAAGAGADARDKET